MNLIYYKTIIKNYFYLWWNYIDISGGGDCWFKCFYKAIYDTEIYHTFISKKIYEILLLKKDEFKRNNITITDNNNKLILASNYFENIKFLHYWAGCLEIGESSILYNCNVIIYKVAN